MISRKTIYSLLLASLAAAGVFAWNTEKRDECDMAGANRTTMQVVIGQAGKVPVVANCSDWLPRQPQGVQGAVFLDAAAWVVFGLSLAWDVKRSAEEQEALRGRRRW